MKQPIEEANLENLKQIRNEIPNLSFPEIVEKIGETHEQLDLYLSITRESLKDALINANYSEEEANKIAKQKLMPKNDEITDIKNLRIDNLEKYGDLDIIYLKFQDQNGYHRHRHLRLNDVNNLDKYLDATLKELLINYLDR